MSAMSPLELSVRSLRGFWLDMANWHELHGETNTLTYRHAADRLGALLPEAPSPVPGQDSFHRTLAAALARTVVMWVCPRCETNHRDGASADGCPDCGWRPDQ